VSEKNVNDEDLEIFKISFDFDDWPGIHTDDSYLIKPYSGSYFDIRFHYEDIFKGYDPIDGKDVGDQ
jgi:hypothetical protein